MRASVSSFTILIDRSVPISETRQAEVSCVNQLGRLLHAFEFDDEVENRVSGDGAGRAAFAIPEIGRHPQFDHPAFTDELHAFGPSGDDAVQRKGGCFTAVIGIVEDFPVVEPATVVD